jgi:hypothetical protein
MPIPDNDKRIIRELARRKAELAALPVMKETAELYRKIHDHEPARAAIQVSQVPWNEMDVDGELACQCEDDFCRGIESGLRMELYSWEHMPGDMTIGGSVGSGLVIRDTEFGLQPESDVCAGEEGGIVSRAFHVQIAGEDDIDKIKDPVVTCDHEATERNYQKRCEIFDGVLPVHKTKHGAFWFAPWDWIVQWTGVEEALLDLALRPEYIHKLMTRFIDAWMVRLRQYEEQDLLAAPPEESVGIGAAQPFSEVSPAMHEEFALRHEVRFLGRFKEVVYGCCEPLDLKVDVCMRNLPNLTQISMSPFIDFDRGVANVGDKLVFHWKPNPAVLASERWDPDAVRADLREKLGKAAAGGCSVIATMKDISTVRHEPQRLWDWARIAKETAEEVA